jgi:hypothetical protein
MRVILGLDVADAGTALVGGQPYASLRRPLTRVGSLLDAGALEAYLRLTRDAVEYRAVPSAHGSFPKDHPRR